MREKKESFLKIYTYFYRTLWEENRYRCENVLNMNVKWRFRLQTFNTLCLGKPSKQIWLHRELFTIANLHTRVRSYVNSESFTQYCESTLLSFKLAHVFFCVKASRKSCLFHSVRPKTPNAHLTPRELVEFLLPPERSLTVFFFVS